VAQATGLFSYLYGQGSVDILVVQRLATELDELLRGSRIDQVYALPKNDIVMVTGRRSGPRLWFSGRPDLPHLYLRDGAHPTPKRPPGFAMAARNLLVGRRIAAVRWLRGDRIIELLCAGNEGTRVVFEIIPRRATAMIVSGADEVRAVWQPRRGRPEIGAAYAPPRTDTRAEITGIPAETWRDLLAAPDDDLLARGLLRSIAGMSPLAAREIVWRHRNGEPLAEAAANELRRAEAEPAAARIYSPLPLDEMTSLPAARDFVLAPYTLHHRESRPDVCTTPFDSLTAAANTYYPLHASLAALTTARETLSTAIDVGVARLRRTLDAVANDAAGAGKAEQHRRWADLLLAFPQAQRRGDAVRVPDPYAPDTDAELDIPINPALSLVDNAQAYYRRARRAERSAERTAKRRAQLASSVTALEQLRSPLEQTADAAACAHLARAARAHGVKVQTDRWFAPESTYQGCPEPTPDGDAMPRPGSRSAPGGATPAAPGIDSYVSSDGFAILVGRNARANDQLTHKLAAPHDFWLHAEGPGSHVLIRNPQRADLPGEDALREAASLAAQFSRARGATKVNVRWTQVRFVKKPRGAPPGQVILRRSQTVLAEPMEPQRLFADADDPDNA